jgi:D-glycero-D-manno-heptose 1,7-bisphosphate phosphatase
MVASASRSFAAPGTSGPAPHLIAMKVIVLDRDGVINEDSDAFVKSEGEWIPIAGSLEAIARLNQAGYRLVVATNQSGLGRGLLTLDDLNAMHQRLHDRLAELGGQVDAIFFCPHSPEDQCACRKPRPGLLVSIRERFGLAPCDLLVIGDSLRDLESAWAAGVEGALVLSGKGARTLADYGERLGATPVYRDLAAVADAILAAS